MSLSGGTITQISADRKRDTSQKNALVECVCVCVTRHCISTFERTVTTNMFICVCVGWGGGGGGTFSIHILYDVSGKLMCSICVPTINIVFHKYSLTQ